MLRHTKWLKSTTATPSTSGTSLISRGPVLAAVEALDVYRSSAGRLELGDAAEMNEEDAAEKREDEATGLSGDAQGSAEVELGSSSSERSS